MEAFRHGSGVCVWMSDDRIPVVLLLQYGMGTVLVCGSCCRFSRREGSVYVGYFLCIQIYKVIRAGVRTELNLVLHIHKESSDLSTVLVVDSSTAYHHGLFLTKLFLLRFFVSFCHDDGQ